MVRLNGSRLAECMATQRTSGRTGGLTLGAAIICTGLLAGLYYAFCCAVMPGLANVDDPTFVRSMRQINVAIINPWFMLGFLGAPLLTAISVITVRRGGTRRASGWVIAALALHVVAFGVTAAISVPLNNALADGAGRAAFETTWNVWNAVRALACVAALGCLVRAVLMPFRADETP